LAGVAARAVVFLAVARAMTRAPLWSVGRVASATQRAERICLPCAGGNRRARGVCGGGGPRHPAAGHCTLQASKPGCFGRRPSGTIVTTARRRRAE
jgi:hypothetical protein